MYAILTGPVLWLSFAVCIGGLIARGVWYVKGLNWQLDRVPYGQYTSYAVKGALKSVLYWLLPYGSRSWRVNPGFAALFFILHLGIIVTPLFLFAHGLVITERFGIPWPAIPNGLADALTLGVLAAGTVILLRRFALPEVRVITRPEDILVMAITLAPFLTGFVAAHSGGQNSPWLIAHIVAGEVMLVALPFTKLSHSLLFFLSRAQIGIDFGVKRGGMKGRGIVW